jgi:hypothetical protein
MELASYHPSGAQNFALTRRFLEKKKKIVAPPLAYGDIMRLFVSKETICFTASEFEVTAATVSSIRVKHYKFSHHYIIVITLRMCFIKCAEFIAWSKNNPSARG